MKTHSVATAQLCISLMFTLQDLSSSLKAVTRKSFLNIEIVTLGYTSREGIGALPFTAPVMDIVVSQLNLLYQTSFNISQTYRFAENSTCQDLKETSEVYFSEWYYRPTGSFDLRAYIAPSKHLSRDDERLKIAPAYFCSDALVIRQLVMTVWAFTT
ncbi:hypothetical protein RvY_06316-2 [Ramazzottius varieornatus]|uniref:Uncharacterized protein n=1 Tax=Ramazzottius varieornatus TaxID=947166 RepID=A0A1D1UY53_RAMVA|nr:hypothetical protein RvY_06316-2 [Ramazzottius varieornatus]